MFTLIELRFGEKVSFCFAVDQNDVEAEKQFPRLLQPSSQNVPALHAEQIKAVRTGFKLVLAMTS